ncbi:hypothetical protein ACIBTV_27615 [Micromonospora sp. NPDC049366]|uniref:hypothetical protein n=1 Tax=Micromonospora sp. NPDC049366 TaxID=3364271 RepID=UPI0037AB28FF
MYDIEFIDAATGATIGSAPREKALPAGGSDVVLEHAIHGPVRYRVTRVPEHWYAHRTGRLAQPDQYAGTSVKVYLQAAGGRS